MGLVVVHNFLKDWGDHGCRGSMPWAVPTLLAGVGDSCVSKHHSV